MIANGDNMRYYASGDGYHKQQGRIMNSLGKGISSNFSLYDQIGYMLVGAVSLLLAALDIWIPGKGYLLPEFALQNTLVWIVIAYLLGHIVQAVANLLIRENKESVEAWLILLLLTNQIH